MEQDKIIFITHGQFENDFLRKLADGVEHEFHYQVKFLENPIDLSIFYDRNRRQYEGNILLKELDAMAIPGTVKKIGLFRIDLFIPILTYIFGQAIYKGDTGIASIYRLRNEQYGMKSDEELLVARFRKVIIHELGHTMGLIHCHVPNCVMRSSTYVEDIDQKEQHLCNKCREELMNR